MRDKSTRMSKFIRLTPRKKCLDINVSTRNQESPKLIDSEVNS